MSHGRTPEAIEAALAVFATFPEEETGLVFGERPIDIVRAVLGAPPTDEHHTMAELYEHRHGLVCVMARTNRTAWKSRKHSDGEPCFGGGWFLCGMYLPGTGALITYHMPEAWWDRCQAFEVDTAPEWDGHTSDMVLEGLKIEAEY